MFGNHLFKIYTVFTYVGQSDELSAQPHEPPGKLGRYNPVYEVELDGVDDRSVSRAIVDSIATLTGKEPAELDPLWGSVDLEAIDSLVTHSRETTGQCRVTFQYQRYTVEVSSDRWLRIAPIEVRPVIGL